MKTLDHLNILTIGNSFTDSLGYFFEDVVKSANCKLHFERANFGGCELERHWSYIQAEEANPVCRIYQGGRKLRDILANRQWDIVTMQQASHDSWRPETFQPFARNIYNYIKKHAPRAEVMIQQTWAYRADHPQFRAGSTWGINQSIMHERLTENYRKLAAELGNLQIIPTGMAVKLSRENEAYPFHLYDPAELDLLHYPDLPRQSGDVVGNLYWYKDATTEEMAIGADLIHLNIRGQYMQACLWFAFLYHRPTSEITFVPENIGKSDAAFLRKMAQRAIDEI